MAKFRTNWSRVFTSTSTNQHIIAQLPGQQPFAPVWRRNPQEQWKYYRDPGGVTVRFETYNQAAAYFNRRGIYNYR